MSIDSPVSDTPAEFIHISVLSREVIAGLQITPGKHYLDATLGGGGHSKSILEVANTRVTGIDRDEQALAAAQICLSEYKERVDFWQGNFAEYKLEQPIFSGVIADLGVSSVHLDFPERGFSFRHTGELDMRMDRRQSLTAAEVINTWDERELANLFFTYGEERLSRRIARQIVNSRPLQTTTALAEVISRSVPPKYRYGRIHPATRVFQALRIAVNEEIASLETFLEKAPNWLLPGGRIAIISFHSLEDRLVKHAFKESSVLQVVTKKPITAQEDELGANPRSRSAKLRIAERC
jgi:16S rRNA (cytosine1402-N4)-methyltransferase